MYRRIFLTALLASSLSVTASCGKRIRPYSHGSDQVGYASWYGGKFHGRKTASGEVYDMHKMTAAHRKAPFGTRFRVTNLDNSRSTVVRVNDRGPFVRGRIIDLSYAAAKAIGMLGTGTAKVRLSNQGLASPKGTYFLQVGSFRDAGNATRMRSELGRQYPNQPLRLVREEGLHKLWFGPFPREQQAIHLLEELRRARVQALILRR